MEEAKKDKRPDMVAMLVIGLLTGLLMGYQIHKAITPNPKPTLMGTSCFQFDDVVLCRTGTEDPYVTWTYSIRETTTTYPHWTTCTPLSDGKGWYNWSCNTTTTTLCPERQMVPDGSGWFRCQTTTSTSSTTSTTVKPCPLSCPNGMQPWIDRGDVLQ